METKKSILSVMALLCSTLLYGQSDTGSFHTICEHNRTFVKNAEDKTQEDVSDSICSTDSNMIDSVQLSTTVYSGLSIEQLEKLIKLYESYKQDKRERSTLIEHNNQQVLSYYTGESRELTLANLIDVIEEVGLNNQLFVLAQAVLETGHFTSSVCKTITTCLDYTIASTRTTIALPDGRTAWLAIRNSFNTAIKEETTYNS